MASKWKKRLKKVGKMAALAAAAYGASKLGKRAKSKAVEATDDAGIHVRHNAMKDFGPYTHKRIDPTTVRPDKVFGNVDRDDYGVGFKKGGHVKSMGIAKRGGGIAKR